MLVDTLNLSFLAVLFGSSVRLALGDSADSTAGPVLGTNPELPYAFSLQQAVSNDLAPILQAQTGDIFSVGAVRTGRLTGPSLNGTVLGGLSTFTVHSGDNSTVITTSSFGTLTGSNETWYANIEATGNATKVSGPGTWRTKDGILPLVCYATPTPTKPEAKGVVDCYWLQ